MLIGIAWIMNVNLNNWKVVRYHATVSEGWETELQVSRGYWQVKLGHYGYTQWLNLQWLTTENEAGCKVNAGMVVIGYYWLIHNSYCMLRIIGQEVPGWSIISFGLVVFAPQAYGRVLVWLLFGHLRILYTQQKAGYNGCDIGAWFSWQWL